jgi:hypothetical protein
MRAVGRHAVVGGQARDHQRADPLAAQVLLERGADERAVDRLLEQGLAGERGGLRPERVAGSFRTQRRAGLLRHVLDVEDRPPGPAPGSEQRSDPLLGVGIVARAPARVGEPLLDVDQQQRGGRARRHGRCHATAPAAHRVGDHAGP